MALAFASASLACGPEFPNSYYDMPEHQLLRAPEGSFESEIARITADVKLRFKKTSEDKRPMLEVELSELKDALAAGGMPAPLGQQVTTEYERFRKALDVWAGRKTDPEVQQKPDEIFSPGLAKVLPAEFSAYLRGAVAWHGGDWREAQTHWQVLIDLPEKERRHRSVWAAFMLGRACLMDAERGYKAEAAAQAKVWFQKTRELADSGFADPLGLAASSIGWEARALLQQRDYAGAIDLYLQQQAMGEPSALVSLRMAASKAISLGDRLSGEVKAHAELARSPLARRVLTAYLISRFKRGEAAPEPTENLQAWAKALRAADVRDVPDAERMAWLAYDAGLFPLAWEWIALAKETIGETQWLRAKLALRGGDLPTGERLLKAALENKGLSASHRSQVAGELARVCLARDDFAGALSASMTGGHWEDAAYVAERVMTVPELKQWVDALPSVDERAEGAQQSGSRIEAVDDSWPRYQASSLRLLLARRLARLGKTDAAMIYFAEPLRQSYRDYIEGVKRGYDRTATAAERAAGFWAAAQIAREKGMALLGTELDPDWAIWDGDFDMTPSRQVRPPREKREPLWRYVSEENQKKEPSIWQPTELESQRIWDQPAPEKRFHYRYRAAELAWWAASLLPNESDETAKILATAGGWLKARDPQAAKPFYQALVIRCGATELGRRAEERRWFPTDETPKDREL